MSSYTTIRVEQHALSSVQESLAIGKQVLERKLSSYVKRVQQFETQHNMDSNTFSALFECGELGDEKTWFEWDHIVSVINVLRKKLHDLETIRYEA